MADEFVIEVNAEAKAKLDSLLESALSKYTKCPICQSGDAVGEIASLASVTKVHAVASVKCKNCGHISFFSPPGPNPLGFTIIKLIPPH